MTRLVRSLIGLFAAPFLVSGSSTAYAETPSMLFHWGEKGSPKAFNGLLSYAKCVVHAERGLTAKFLASNYPSKDRDGKVSDLLEGAALCVDSNLMLDFQFLRGVLIEALYEEDLLDHSGKPLVTLGTSAADEKGVAPLTQLARCVVGRQPEKSAELLRTRIASAEQAQAIAALEPDIEQCARETNSAKTYPELLRFQVAEELYRRASNKQIAAGIAK